MHGMLGDGGELLASDSDLAQPPRQPQIRDEVADRPRRLLD
jgi:hypothetical protein